MPKSQQTTLWGDPAEPGDRGYPKGAPGKNTAGHPAAALFAPTPTPGWWLLRFDGGVRGNGSASAAGRWAYRLTDPAGTVRAEASGKATGAPVTVNTAEWEGLFRGVGSLLSVPYRACPGVLIEGDSDLVVSQVAGRWAARGPLLDWRDKTLTTLAGLRLPWHARWIPRERNADCDALCTMKTGPRPFPTRPAPAPASARVVAPAGSAVLTAELIEAGRTAAGGWSRAKLALIGVPWPPPGGWKRAAVGRVIPEAALAEFLGANG